MDRKIGQVYETRDYDKFKFVHANRPVVTSGKTFKALCDDLQAHGQIEPALVTPSLEIINGQHRLAACKKLGIPFKYTYGGVVATAEHIAAANSSTRWKLVNYIHFYANQTTSAALNYKYLQALLKEFSVPMSCYASILHNNGPNFDYQIKTGKFKMSTKMYEEVRTCLSDLRDLGYMQYIKEFRMPQRAYWVSVVYAWKHPKVDVKRLIKVMYANAHRLPSTVKNTEFMAVLAELYNKGLSTNRVRFNIDYEDGKFKKWEAE